MARDLKSLDKKYLILLKKKNVDNFCHFIKRRATFIFISVKIIIFFNLYACFLLIQLEYNKKLRAI